MHINVVSASRATFAYKGPGCGFAEQIYVFMCKRLSIRGPNTTIIDTYHAVHPIAMLLYHV